MSFKEYKKFISEGDVVILHLGFDRMHQIKVKEDEVFQTKFGALRHSDLIGAEFGSRVSCSNGWVYALHPTPELWTINLPHRTQILYTADIGLITLQLDLKCGSVVVESGTGSGSLSHALLRTVTPEGYLHTFDFHEQRANQARAEFKEHGLAEFVTVYHRDVCEVGFDLESVADAVFLDLPKPWLVIPAAKRAMKTSGGRVCSFSPCIEQVQRTCEALRDHGFAELETVECLSRPHSVHSVNMPLPDLGHGPGAGPYYDYLNKRRVTAETDTNTKCKQLEPSPKQATSDNTATTTAESDNKSENEFDEGSAKKLRTNDQPVSNCDADNDINDEITNQSLVSKSPKHDQEFNGGADKKSGGSSNSSIKKPSRKYPHFDESAAGDSSFYFKTCSMPTQITAHTGYLTFASLYPQ